MPRRAAVLLFGLLAAPAWGQDGPRFMMEPVRIGTLKAVPADSGDDLPPRRNPTPLRAARDRDAGTIPAGLVEKPFAAEKQSASKPREGNDEFLDLPSAIGLDRKKPRADPPRKDRSAVATLTGNKLGDGIGDLFDGEKPVRKTFESDRGFNQFASPISNPFLFEDPRAVSEIRPLFIYQKVPGEQPNFEGGNIWFLGMRGSLAITDRLSVTLNKLGGVYVDPKNETTHESSFGVSEIWLGPKYTIYRDADCTTILAAGGIFQIPIGSSGTFQDTGSFGVTPYISAGHTLLQSSYGSLNTLGTFGYSFGDSGRSDYFYLSGHLDFDVGDMHRFYPVFELNWFQYTKDGSGGTVAGEGRDIVNFGGVANNSTLLTAAMGGRIKITESSQVGAAFELPVLGNRDFQQYRFTVDFIFRY